MGDISAVLQFNTVSADCPTRFQNFIAGCNEIYGDQLPARVCMLVVIYNMTKHEKTSWLLYYICTQNIPIHSIRLTKSVSCMRFPIGSCIAK